MTTNKSILLALVNAVGIVSYSIVIRVNPSSGTFHKFQPNTNVGQLTSHSSSLRYSSNVQAVTILERFQIKHVDHVIDN